MNYSRAGTSLEEKNEEEIHARINVTLYANLLMSLDENRPREAVSTRALN